MIFTHLAIFASILYCYVGATVIHSHDASFVPDAVLRAAAQNISIGGINRYTTIANGSQPGPPLRLQEGKVTWVRVYNDMANANLTMHWHGLAQAAYSFSDGTPLASQWPIPPQHFFDYELLAENGSAGSYFYHSHVDFQTVSCSGPLIVEDGGAPPYRTDGERIIYLQELFNESDATILEGLQATPFIWSGETNGFLVNGKTISDYGVTDQSSTLLDVITVEPGKTYRFRFIAATSLSIATIGLQHHKGLQIIEADGNYTRKHPVDILQMGSGQRYSTILTAKTCSELDGQLDYYMQLESRARPTVVTNYAILRYSNSCGFTNSTTLSHNSYPTSKPIALPDLISGWLDYMLEPLHPNNFPSASEVTRRVTINIQQYFDKYSVWQDDNVTWVEDASDPLPHTSPGEPYLVALYNNQTAYLPSYEAAITNGGVDRKTKTFPGKLGEVVEIVLQNIGSHSDDPKTPGGGLDVHPWHAHGRHYYDIGGGDGVYVPSIAEGRLNGTQPVQRDTTILYRYNETTQPNQKRGWRAWRLRVDDPGVWMIHCHTLQHMIMGMQTVWVFGDANNIMRLPPRDVSGYLVYGGDVYGNATHSPQVVHFNEIDGSGE